MALALYFGIGVALTVFYHARHLNAFVTVRENVYGDRMRVTQDPTKAAACIVFWPMCGLLFLGEEVVS